MIIFDFSFLSDKIKLKITKAKLICPYYKLPKKIIFFGFLEPFRREKGVEKELEAKTDLSRKSAQKTVLHSFLFGISKSNCSLSVFGQFQINSEKDKNRCFLLSEKKGH